MSELRHKGKNIKAKVKASTGITNILAILFSWMDEDDVVFTLRQSDNSNFVLTKTKEDE